MIDTHCHLLPGLDDGPRTIDEAVALATELVGQGVETVVCTPHYCTRFPTDHDAAAAALDRLAGELRELGVPLRLELGAEVGDVTAVSAPLEELRRRAIRMRSLVVEIAAGTNMATLESIVARLVGAGLVPVLAHPERSRLVQRDVAVLDGPRAAGALVQLVAPTLLGRWGEEAEDAAWELIESGRADLLGSDAHGVDRRRPYLGEIVARIRDAFGAAAALALVQRGPERLLEAGEVPAHP